MKKSVVITIVTALVVGATGFYGGLKYQQNQRSNLEGRQFTRNGNLQGNVPVSGEIISQDDNSVTLNLQDGSSKIIILSDQTSINRASEGTKSDLKTGESITAFGTANSDGSITAQNISIGGNMMFRVNPEQNK